jgi:hypothetical protein
MPIGLDTAESGNWYVIKTAQLLQKKFNKILRDLLIV